MRPSVSLQQCGRPIGRRRTYSLAYSLLGRVVKLVLVGAREALLDPGVGPQSLHGRQQVVGERLRVLHARYHVHDLLRVRLHMRDDSGSAGQVGQQI